MSQQNQEKTAPKREKPKRATPHQKTIARLGAEPDSFNQLMKKSQFANDMQRDDLAIGLHLTHNRLLEIRKIIRVALRAPSTHTPAPDSEPKYPSGSKQPFQEPCMLMRLWQEEVSNACSPDLLRANVYGRLRQEIPEFAMTFKNENGTAVPDWDAMEKITRPDPANSQGPEVACMNYSMKEPVLRKLIHLEMETMKTSAEARTAFDELEIKWPCFWKGPVEERVLNYGAPTTGKLRTNKQPQPVANRAVYFTLAGDANSATNAATINPLSSVLEQSLNKYPAAGGFPYDKISKDKVLAVIKQLRGVPADAANGGWLKFKMDTEPQVEAEANDNAAMTDAVTKVWRIELGNLFSSQFPKLVKYCHLKFPQGTMVLQLEYVVGNAVEDGVSNFQELADGLKALEGA